jgi:predicted dinucleotide-binding enzyme
MNTLGVIGSGAIGSGVARLAVAAGMDVVLSNSRGPQTLTDLVADLGERARAGTVAEAAAAGDAVLLAIPLKAVLTLPPDLLAGKLVLDTSNYYPGRDGQIAELDSDELTTSQLVQRHLVGARVVKAFNSIGANQLTTRGRPATPTAVPCRSPETTTPPSARPPSCWTASASTRSTPAGQRTAGAPSPTPRCTSCPTSGHCPRMPAARRSLRSSRTALGRRSRPTGYGT